MPDKEIKDYLEEQGKAWEQFKSVNDRRLDEIQKKGETDFITKDQLGKINDAMDGYKERMDKLETSSRASHGVAEDGKKSDPDAIEYKNAFNSYLRKGYEGGLADLEAKTLSVGSETDGGYLVTPETSSQIIKIINETTPMRQLASVTSVSSDELEYTEDRGDADAGWTGETGVRSDTGTPDVSKKSIKAHEMYAQPKATQKLIDDASINIEQWLAGKVADIMSRNENTAFITGDGVGKPRGILTYTAGTNWGQIQQINSGSSGAVTADSLTELVYALKEGYASRASFLMKRSLVQDVRLLKDTNGQYMWQPGLTSGQPDSLLGYPVIQATDMPAASAGTLSVAYGDFGTAYQIVDRLGIRVLRDPFTDKPFIKFYSTKRVGGDVINFEAIKLLKLSA